MWHHRGIGVGFWLCIVAICTSYTHYNVIYMFFHIIDSFYICGWNLGYCFRWMIRWNIYKIYWINIFFNETNTLYGAGRIWLLTVVIHNVLHMSLYLQVAYMVLWRLVKIKCNNHLLFPYLFNIYTVAVGILHCGEIYHHVSPWVDQYINSVGYTFSTTQVPGYPIGLVSRLNYRSMWNWSNYCWWEHYW